MRAPIPQKNETLVEDVPAFGMFCIQYTIQLACNSTFVLLFLGLHSYEV